MPTPSGPPPAAPDAASLPPRVRFVGAGDGVAAAAPRRPVRRRLDLALIGQGGRQSAQPWWDSAPPVVLHAGAPPCAHSSAAMARKCGHTSPKAAALRRCATSEAKMQCGRRARTGSAAWLGPTPRFYPKVWAPRHNKPTLDTLEPVVWAHSPYTPRFRRLNQAEQDFKPPQRREAGQT